MNLDNITCDDLPEGFQPTAQDYFKYIAVGYIVGISLCGALTLVVLISYLESVVFLMRNLGNWKPRDKAIWLLGLYPVLCVTSLFSLTIPRAALLNELIASIYLSLCVYLFVVMLVGHFGGKDKMSKRLRLDDGTKIDPRRPLLLCCCRCLPLCDITTFRIRLLDMTVLQYALFKPIYSYITATIWANNGLIDENLQNNIVYTVVSLCDVISTLLAGWGFSVMFKISQIPLEKVSIKPKFIVLQLVMLISTFQPLFIALLISVGAIPCNGALTASANGLRWHNMIFIGEMCALSWFSRYYYRRHVGKNLSPEDREVKDTVDQRTSVTETLDRMAQADQILRVGELLDSRQSQNNGRNKYGVQQKTKGRENYSTSQQTDKGASHFQPHSNSTKAPQGRHFENKNSMTSAGTDPINFDDLKALGKQSNGGQSSSDESEKGDHTKHPRSTGDVVLDIK